MGVYIYESESIAIRKQEHIGIWIGTQESGVYRKGTQECYVGTRDRNRNKNKNRNWNWD